MPHDLALGSVCTGYGGLDLGVLAALSNTLGGGRVAWCADPDPHIATILAARMPDVPNLGDVRAVDWARVEPVDVLTAGFPCQDISAAGRRAGIEKGVRSGLWADIVAGVRVLRPALVVVENVAALRWKNGGLHRVLGDLAEAGYDALWRSVRAADIGAAHRRERVFLLAWHRTRSRPRTRRGDDGHTSGIADADRARRLLERCLGVQQAGRPFTVGPAAAAPHTDRVGREELHTPDAERWSVAARPSPSCPRPTAADTDRSRLPLRGDPDGAHTGASHPNGVRDPHRLGAPAAHPTSNRHRDGGTPSRKGIPATTVAAGAPVGGLRGPVTTSVTDSAADAASDRRDEGVVRRSVAPRAT